MHEETIRRLQERVDHLTERLNIQMKLIDHLRQYETLTWAKLTRLEDRVYGGEIDPNARAAKYT